MSKILVISDIHGDIDGYLDILNNSEEYDLTFQLGDLLIGFPDVKEIPNLDQKHKFIMGNHDNPSLIRKHRNFAGDYGEDKKKSLFFLGGAETPLHSKNQLKEGVNWWPDEELPISSLCNAIRQYELLKPKLVLTHEAPDIARRRLFGIKNKTNTSFALQAMFEIHQPDLWVFGHHHVDVKDDVDGTVFVCKPILGTYEVIL